MVSISLKDAWSLEPACGDSLRVIVSIPTRDLDVSFSYARDIINVLSFSVISWSFYELIRYVKVYYKNAVKRSLVIILLYPVLQLASKPSFFRATNWLYMLGNTACYFRPSITITITFGNWLGMHSSYLVRAANALYDKYLYLKLPEAISKPAKDHKRPW